MNGGPPGRRRFLALLAATGAAGVAPVAPVAPVGAAPRARPSAAQAFRSSFEPVAESYGPTRVPFDRPLPKGLAGRLLRCGPARLRRGDTVHEHWFDGDGMVHSFTLAGRHLRHHARMVRTTRYVAEEAAGRFEWPSWATARPDGRPVRSPDDVNTANTSVLPVGDELLALWEGGSPWRLDPDTLETLGRAVLSAPTDGLPFSAHPRRDADGTLWSFGHAAGSGRLVLYALDRRGRLLRTGLVDAPNADSVHDFAITERFLVFTLFPWMRDDAAVDANASVLDRLRWDDAARVVVLLIDKRGLEVVRRFSLDPFFAYHFGNAWEDGDAVRLEVARSPGVDVLMEAVRLATRGEAAPRLPRPAATDVVLDPRSGKAVAEPLPVAGLEFPAWERRRTGVSTSSLFGMTANASLPAGAFGHNELVGFDRGSGTVRRYDFGTRVLAEEHVHAPDPSARDRGGWLLGTSFDWEAGRTSLNVFDADDVSAGPVAVATLPYKLPLGLHGHFTPA